MVTKQHATDVEDRVVLPKHAKPLHYELFLKPDLTSFVFEGRVNILIKFLESANKVALNYNELDIKDINLTVKDEVYKPAVHLRPEKETVVCDFGERHFIEGTEAVLSIDYAGTINDKMTGFYRSSYVDPKTGGTKFMGVTQFEATDARKAFPCWDEPSMKATFAISITAPRDLVVLSNMDEEQTNQMGDVVEHRFRKTPVMSTYLVAWAVGELEHIETRNAHGVQVRVFTPPGEKERGRFALDVAAKTLDFFSDYFGLPYPLPKLDMLAVPDFSAGAMENWGLVTYRTVYILFDEQQSSLAIKQHVAYVVGHELAHQWFGNLVTMEWWSDLWLNEGFATWVGWLAADHLFPEWDIWTEFVQDDCQQGLTLDSMRSSHPIEVPVRDPAEISQIFDAISYSKGASVIRMLVEHLGEQAFQRGLQHYLRAFQYANAQTRDLWQALGDASGQDIHSLMHHWTKSPGFPLILVEESNGQASGKTTTGCGSCCLRQSRFLSSGKAKADEDTITWQVPVHIKTDTLTSKQLVTARQSALDLAEDNASFVKLNAGQSGFYRVKYPPTWLVRLGKAVEASALGAADRLGLVSDVFALAYSGDAVLSEALTLLGHFSKEDNHLVWGQIQGRLQQILSVWFEEPEEVQQRIKHFCRQLVSPAALRSGFDFPAGEPDAQRLLRPILLGLAARAQEPAILAEARERFERFRVQQATSAIHPDLRGVIFGAMMREARTEAEAMDLFEYFVALYGDASLVPDLRLAALGSTGASAYAKVTQRALDLLVQPNSVLRPQDHHYVVSAVGNGPLRRQCWQFVHEHWSHFEQLFSKGSMSMLGYLIKGSCSALCSPADAQSVLAFFAPLDTSKVDRAIEQSVERIRANADFLQRNRPDLERFFSSLSSRPPLQ